MGQRIYLVEDDEGMRALLKMRLRDAGADVVAMARSEGEAKEWLADHAAEWDLAIVDLNLHGGSGFGVVRHCRSRQPTQKVVVFTVYAPAHVRSQCRALGADFVFDKSSEMEVMLDFCRARVQAASSRNAPAL